MVHLIHVKRPFRIWVSIGKGVQSRANDHILMHPTADCARQLILGEATAGGNERPKKGRKGGSVEVAGIGAQH
jgi:hypothetical protein